MKNFLLTITFFLMVQNFYAETITFHADMMSGNTQNKNKPTKLIGHAYVKTDTMEISADSIAMSGDDYRYILAEGNVIGKNTESKMDFTCGKMKYDRETKIARLEDTVTLKDLDNDVDAKAQIIDYNQNTEIAVLQIDVDLKQKDNTCTCAYAIYNKTAQMLEMNGNPKIVQGEDTFRAQVITLNLDTQEITLDGRVSGTVKDSKPANDEPKTSPPPTDTQDTPAEPITQDTQNIETPDEKSDNDDSENITQKAVYNFEEGLKSASKISPLILTDSFGTKLSYLRVRSRRRNCNPRKLKLSAVCNFEELKNV